MPATSSGMSVEAFVGIKCWSWRRCSLLVLVWRRSEQKRHAMLSAGGFEMDSEYDVMTSIRRCKSYSNGIAVFSTPRFRSGPYGRSELNASSMRLERLQLGLAESILRQRATVELRHRHFGVCTSVRVDGHRAHVRWTGLSRANGEDDFLLFTEGIKDGWSITVGLLHTE